MDFGFPVGFPTEGCLTKAGSVLEENRRNKNAVCEADLGISQNLTTRGPQVLAPCFHFPGQPILGIPYF